MKTENHYLISETAKLVGVESHVLRYWEDELKLPIRRNEMGHRYYTEEDVIQFTEIKKMKEQGLQLKAIRTILTVPSGLNEAGTELGNLSMSAENRTNSVTETENKTVRLQQLLYALISQAVKENNEELSELVRDRVIKELDYQFRLQEEENERRNKVLLEREEEYFRQFDEKLRSYSENRKWRNHDKKKWSLRIRKAEQ